MGFELETGETIEAGVRRIVDAQLESALGDLNGADPDRTDDAVHATRKRFKRLRAVLRLVRGAIDDATFARENAAFRDAGGSLSEARDAHVLVAALDGLKERVDPAEFAAAREFLVERRRFIRERVLERADGLKPVADAVTEARDRARSWRIERDGWAALKPGLKRVYRDGRRAFDHAEPGAPAERFHDWRKRTKDLWHQLEVLGPAWPQALEPLAEEFHHLASYLGDEHDLAVLKEVLEAEAPAREADGANDPATLPDAIDRRRLELQQAARALGTRLFAEKPGAFAKRLGKYWRAWAAQAAAAPVVEDASGDASFPSDSAA